MSLWTPDGEHEVAKETNGDPNLGVDGENELNEIPGFDDLTPVSYTHLTLPTMS